MSATDDDDRDKKPNVIHTRVPEDLDAEIKRRANSLGVSVSNLVRNVLSHAFGLVGDIVADGANVARSAKGIVSPVGVTPPSSTPVLGWQEAILALNAVCGRCNAILKRGTSAAIAVPGGNAVLCKRCLKEVLDGNE